MSSTFISTAADPGPGLRLAVKDNVDVAGLATTGGSRSLAGRPAAEADAECVALVKAGGASVVGKANLQELCAGTTGINPWFGTPTNPCDPGLVPGGSSSGSAVAVGSGEADAAIGSDTAGSVRIPATCCGVVGFKPTTGRVPMEGVFPLSPTLDTVGPLARDVETVERLMRMLDPSLEEVSDPAGRILRFRGMDTADEIDEAVTVVLNACELDVGEVVLPAFQSVVAAGGAIAVKEGSIELRRLVKGYVRQLGADPKQVLELGKAVEDAVYSNALSTRSRWIDELMVLLRGDVVIVMPVLPIAVPTLDRAEELGGMLATGTMAWSVSGSPAAAVPIASGAGPAGVQIVGAPGADALVLRTASHLEAVARTL